MAKRRSSEQKHAGLHVNIETPSMSFRNELGRYQSAQGEQIQANRELALTMQATVGRVIENNMLRPNVSSGRLLRATLDEKNITWNLKYVGIGNIDFLDQSIAKYWRTIEEGSAKTWNKRSFLDLELQGLWGTNIAGWQRSAAEDDWISLGGKRTRGARGQEMYHPMSKGPFAKLPVFHPHKHIRPQHAYKYVADDPVFNRAGLLMAQKFIRRVMDSPIKPAGFRGGIYDHGVG